MNNVSTRRKALLFLVLAVFVTTPWASASPQAENSRWTQAFEDISLLKNFWSFLRSMWDKEGCNIDPNGRCVTGPDQNPPLQPKEGCNIDPDGHCVKEPVQNPKAGCNNDPWGHCIQELPPSTNIGCNIDPDGRCIS